MKKLIILLISIIVPVVAFGQATIKTNFVIEKSAPTLNLKGSNGVINFNSGDVTLTNTSNTLTIVGGILALPANGLIINSINALYGETDTLSQKYATIASTYTQDQTNTLLAGKQDTGVVSMTYPGSGIALSTGTAWGTSITNNSVNWNTAYTDRFKWDGGSTGLTASTGRTSLGATTVGSNLFTLTNPGAISFIRINADNTVNTRSVAELKTDLSLQNVTNESKATMFTSPTFTGTVTIPTPFNLGAVSVTTIGTQLNYLSGTTGYTGTGKLMLNTSPTIEGHPTIEGVTSTGATGTGNLVFSNSPTLVTPALGTPSAIVLTNATGTASGLTAGSVSGFTPASGSLTLSGADAITFTTTGVTGVTLPTSGTLATTTDAALGKLVAITASLSAGEETDVTLTGITTMPYALQIFDANGLDLTYAVKDSIGISAGTYHVWIYSTDAKTDAKIRVLW